MLDSDRNEPHVVFTAVVIEADNHNQTKKSGIIQKALPKILIVGVLEEGAQRILAFHDHVVVFIAAVAAVVTDTAVLKIPSRSVPLINIINERKQDTFADTTTVYASKTTVYASNVYVPAR